MQAGLPLDSMHDPVGFNGSLNTIYSYFNKYVNHLIACDHIMYPKGYSPGNLYYTCGRELAKSLGAGCKKSEISTHLGCKKMKKDYPLRVQTLAILTVFFTYFNILAIFVP